MGQSVPIQKQKTWGYVFAGLFTVIWRYTVKPLLYILGGVCLAVVLWSLPALVFAYILRLTLLGKG